MNCWSLLGIEPTKDIAAIKRAYSVRSREVHPEDSPEEFRFLHEAYLEALARARQTDAVEAEPCSDPPPVVRASAVESSGFRDIVCSAELEEAEILNSAFENTLSRLEELIASRGSVDDYVSALGTAVALGSLQTRVCFFAAFVGALTDFIKTQKKLPDTLYEAVTVIYDFSPGLAPSPAKDLQPLYNVLRERRRLTTRKERRLEKWSSVFVLVPMAVILILAVLGLLSDAFFIVAVCLVTIIVSACVTGALKQKPRAPGPYSEELQKYRKRRKLR